jgi:hypothetical protein
MAWIAGVPQQRAGRPARKYYNYALSRIRMANTIFVLDLYDVRINTCVFFVRSGTRQALPALTPTKLLFTIANKCLCLSFRDRRLQKGTAL